MVFDLDGTLTKVRSIWQAIHDGLGTWTRAKEYKDMFFRGEIDYNEWADLDVRLWKNTSISEIQLILSRIGRVDGAKETVRTLKDRGIKVAIISAGLSIFADRIKKEIGADYAISNNLIIKDGKLTGEIRVKVGFNNKDVVLEEVASSLGIPLDQCAVIGDSPGDLPAFKVAGLSIALNPADEKVSESADVTIHSDDIRDILPYLLGSRSLDR